jgi:serine/threonine protein kinase
MLCVLLRRCLLPHPLNAHPVFPFCLFCPTNSAGYKPFQGVSYEGIAAAVIQHAMADLPPHLSPVFKSFIAAALTYDPQQRPSAQQLLDHPWIQVRL